MRTSLIFVAAAAAIIATPAQANANPADDNVFEETVKHDDLDLTTQTGVARLDERVRSRIRQACANGGRDSASLRLERECRASAFAAAQPEMRFAINDARLRDVRLANNSTASNAATPGA